MTPDRTDAGRRQRRKKGAHRKLRQRRSALTRTVAAGGAAIAIGAAYEIGTPTAEALSILVPGPTVDGVTNTTRINIFEGNIFNPQFGIGGSASNNNVIGNIAINLGNQILSQFLDFELNIGGAAAGNGNVTQVNLFSYNIFNPQMSLGPNVSNNTTISNVATNNGNNSTSEVAGGGLPLFGGAMGNGNTVQFSLFSGNIFNPQWSIGGNVSNNTAVTNVAIGNGNNSQSTIGFGGLFGSFLFGGGNGNTTQFGFFVSNIYNPQWSWGGGNTSNNSATTNTSSGNGNNSTNVITGGGLGTIVTGTTGNGQTTQVSNSSGNIFNDQVNVGPSPVSAVTSNSTESGTEVDPLTEALNSLDSSSSTDVDPGSDSPVGSDAAPGTEQLTLGPEGLGDPAPSDDPPSNSPSDTGGDGSGDGGGDGTGGE